MQDLAFYPTEFHPISVTPTHPALKVKRSHLIRCHKEVLAALLSLLLATAISESI